MQQLRVPGRRLFVRDVVTPVQLAPTLDFFFGETGALRFERGECRVSIEPGETLQGVATNIQCCHRPSPAFTRAMGHAR